MPFLTKGVTLKSVDARLITCEDKLDQILKILAETSLSQPVLAKHTTKTSEKKVKTTEKPPPGPPHIMISYNWGVQDLATKIASKLKEVGLTVWIDVDNMEGDLSDAMSDAVEHAMIVVPFLTQKYQDSENCQLELKYAHNQKVQILPIMAENSWRPSRWLGFLVNSKLYVDFREEKQFDNSIQLLLDQLKRVDANYAEAIKTGMDKISSDQLAPPAHEPSKTKLSKAAFDKLPLGVLENTFITHTFLLKETKSGEAVALFRTKNDKSLLGKFTDHFRLYIDYVEYKGGVKPGLRFMNDEEASFAEIINDPNDVVENITENKVKSSFIQGDKGYTLAIKNCTNVSLDAYWVNYEGGMRLLGRHSVPPAPESWNR